MNDRTKRMTETEQLKTDFWTCQMSNPYLSPSDMVNSCLRYNAELDFCDRERAAFMPHECAALNCPNEAEYGQKWCNRCREEMEATEFSLFGKVGDNRGSWWVLGVCVGVIGFMVFVLPWLRSYGFLMN